MRGVSIHRAWARAVGALVLLGLAAGAGACDESTLHRGKPSIAVSPVEVQFPTLNRLETGLQTLSVRNDGTATLAITGMRIEGDAAFTLERWNGQPAAGLAFPFGLVSPGAAGASSGALEVGLTPPAEGDYAAELVIDSNAENAPELRVPLGGRGSVPDIDAQPPLLSFGGVGLQSSASLGLALHNLGEADLVLAADAFTFEGAGAGTPFLVVAGAMRLGQGEQRTIEVIYAPQSARVDPLSGEVIPDTDVLLIASNDPDEDPLAVPVDGRVAGNLPPSVGIRIAEATQLDGTPLVDPCAAAPSDTLRFAATVSDPDGGAVLGSNLYWAVPEKPAGSFRDLVTSPDPFFPSFKADLTGRYTVCLAASDAQGNRSSYDPAQACTCQEARDGGDYQCPCVSFDAFPREDIRVELVWDLLGADLDLHLLAPGGTLQADFCEPTRDCRFNPQDPQDPGWIRTACVTSGAITACRAPNCDPVVAGCLDGQECYDDGVAGPACVWRTCSGLDCYWDGRNPDWGVPGVGTDDPLLAIDCTKGCRAENVNLNNPAPGTYMILVNYYEPFQGQSEATIRVYFKGDLTPTAVYTSRLTAACDTWIVANLEWVDHEDHPLMYLGDAHSSRCCQ